MDFEERLDGQVELRGDVIFEARCIFRITESAE